MQAIFIALKINEKLKRKIQAQNVLIYNFFFFFQFQPNIPLDTGPYCTQYHPVRAPFITVLAAKFVSVIRYWLLCCLLPSSIKWHCGHMLLCTALKFFKYLYKALVATANDIWLNDSLITQGLFLSHEGKFYSCWEKPEKCRLYFFPSVLSGLLFIHSPDNGLLGREEYKMMLGWSTVSGSDQRSR